MPPKNRTMRKAVRKELLTFLREFDQRNVTIQDNLRRFEKLCKEGRDPEQLLIEIYDSFYAITKSINSRQNFNGKTMFHYMCLLGYSNVVKHMLPRFQTSELNLLDMNTRTPLFYAVEIGNEECVHTFQDERSTTSHMYCYTESCEIYWKLEQRSTQRIHEVKAYRKLLCDSDISILSTSLTNLRRKKKKRRP